MKRHMNVLPLLVLLALTPSIASAGFGDMLKEKAKKAVQGDKKGKDAKPASTETGAIKSRIEHLIRDIDNLILRYGANADLAEVMAENE